VILNEPFRPLKGERQNADPNLSLRLSYRGTIPSMLSRSDSFGRLIPQYRTVSFVDQ